MDEPLALLRRAHEAAPDDFATALRLASLCERSGEVVDAWGALAHGHAHARDHRRKGELTVALAALASRERRALLEHFQGLDAKPARRSFELLASTGEIPVLVVIGCDPRSSHQVEAQ